MAKYPNHPVWDVYDEYRTARYEQKVIACKIKPEKRRKFWFELALALFTPTSAIAGLFFFNTPEGKVIWQVCLLVAAVLAVAKPLLRLDDAIDSLKNSQAKYVMLDTT